jgi:hypothetical protein
MTQQEFRRKIRRLYRNDLIALYLVCAFFLGLAIFYSIKSISEGPPKPASWIIIVFLYIFIGYVLWRIPKEFMVTRIDSLKTVEEKRTIIEKYFADVKIVTKMIDNRFISICYQNKYFTRIDARFYIDDDKILFNVQGANTHQLKGVIDFGLTARATRRLEKYLLENMVS